MLVVFEHGNQVAPSLVEVSEKEVLVGEFQEEGFEGFPYYIFQLGGLVFVDLFGAELLDVDSLEHLLLPLVLK